MVVSSRDFPRSGTELVLQRTAKRFAVPGARPVPATICFSVSPPTLGPSWPRNAAIRREHELGPRRRRAASARNLPTPNASDFAPPRSRTTATFGISRSRAVMSVSDQRSGTSNGLVTSAIARTRPPKPASACSAPRRSRACTSTSGAPPSRARSRPRCARARPVGPHLRHRRPRSGPALVDEHVERAARGGCDPEQRRAVQERATGLASLLRLQRLIGWHLDAVLQESEAALREPLHAIEQRQTLEFRRARGASRIRRDGSARPCRIA